MCIDFNAQPLPKTVEAEKISAWLNIIFLIHLTISIAKIFILQDISGGINDLISCFILYMGKEKVNYCYMVIYIMFTGFAALSLLVGIGTIFQQSDSSTTTTDQLLTTPNLLILAIFFFYIFAIYWAFQAYKESKGI